MNSRSLTLNEFIAEYPFRGEWEVFYTDCTHLNKSEFVKLGDITIEANEEATQVHPISPFIFTPLTHRQIKCSFSAFTKEKEKADQATTLIRGQITDSLVRTGLLRPNFCLMYDQEMVMEFRKAMTVLSNHRYLVLVVDTSALRLAAISFLHQTLSNLQIWTVVPVFVMTEVQRQVHELNRIWTSSKNRPNTKNFKAIGMRPQVSTISRELNYIRQWRPLEMLTTFPEHLGQVNGTSRIDRLIIESVKNLKRDRGLHQGVYLLTGDKDMASLATLEDQRSLHVGIPCLRPDVSSVRYDSCNNRLVLTPLHYLLWDLTQVFSTIRLVSQKLSRTFELKYYSQSQGGFFANDVMEIREL